MKLASLFRYVATAAFLGGCTVQPLKGDGKISVDHRQISNFTSLEAAGAFVVQWSSGPPSLTVTADQNLLPHIRTRVSGDLLKIDTDTPIVPTRRVTIVVSSGALTRVDLAGAVALTASRVTSAAFLLTATGASTINVDGNVSELNVELTGASRLNAATLNSKSANVTLTGASSADIAVKESLKATITGAGVLAYSGQPGSVEKQITGAGTLLHK
jgi:hypothetical protein